MFYVLAAFLSCRVRLAPISACLLALVPAHVTAACFESPALAPALDSELGPRFEAIAPPGAYDGNGPHRHLLDRHVGRPEALPEAPEGGRLEGARHLEGEEQVQRPPRELHRGLKGGLGVRHGEAPHGPRRVREEFDQSRRLQVVQAHAQHRARQLRGLARGLGGWSFELPHEHGAHDRRRGEWRRRQRPRRVLAGRGVGPSRAVAARDRDLRAAKAEEAQ
mmetsp:Transcript_40032/g.89763  ORF Transcript_40032/g.89763 Transcript_40032/m.89763 type:complete len:221 (-) Transcript_40032:445-1107(-)